MVSYDLLNLSIIARAVLLEQVVGVGLSWRLGIGVVKKVLDTEQDLLDGDSWFPALLFVQDGQADCAGGVDVGVEEGRDEFALWWLRWVLIGEDHAQLEQASLPHRLLLAWNTALPNLQIKNTSRVALRLRIETKGMVSSPLLSLLLESVLTERHVCGLWSCGVIFEVVGFRGNEMRLRDLLVDESSR